MPALISTIALIAGCGASGRVEVSGVVRDRSTGRAIEGARVVATDGSATRTDARGRFTLSVRGEAGVLRASARDHADGSERIDVLVHDDIELGLEPVVGDATYADPDAVVRYLEESWVDDAMRWSRGDTHDADIAREHDGVDSLAIRAAIALFERGGDDGDHAGLECGDCHDGAAGRALHTLESDVDTHTCSACHAGVAAPAIGGLRDRDHDGSRGVVDAELRSARARARDAIDEAIRRERLERCGRLATTFDDDGALLDDDGRPIGDCDQSGAIDGREIGITIDLFGPRLVTAVADLRLLRDDASRGAHDVTTALAIARSIELAARE